MARGVTFFFWLADAIAVPTRWRVIGRQERYLPCTCSSNWNYSLRMAAQAHLLLLHLGSHALEPRSPLIPPLTPWLCWIWG